MIANQENLGYGCTSKPWQGLARLWLVLQGSRRVCLGHAPVWVNDTHDRCWDTFCGHSVLWTLCPTLRSSSGRLGSFVLEKIFPNAVLSNIYSSVYLLPQCSSDSLEQYYIICFFPSVFSLTRCCSCSASAGS